jgi:hypothetical protein
MSAQPANTTISVFRRLRVVRDNRRHTSVKHLTTPFDSEYVPVPGEEVQVVEHRDAVVSDAFRFGHPVTVQPRTNLSLASLYDGVSGLDFPVRLTGNWREVQVQKTAANVSDDLYGEAATLGSGAAFTI